LRQTQRNPTEPSIVVVLDELADALFDCPGR
jgi:hypothetical protein